MKIALDCRSLLLQDSLHHYLSNYLCDIQYCDFIISDYLKSAPKPIYLLSFEKRTLPFIPEELIERLQDFHRQISSHHSPSQDDELKAEIQSLLMEFADRFLQILKKHR